MNTRRLVYWGKYAKAPGGIHLSLCPSGGRYCPRACPHHPRSIARNADRACYAARSEMRRPELHDKLNRHLDAGPAATLRGAYDELREQSMRQNELPTIIRFSSFGSLPPRPSPSAQRALRQILRFAQRHDIPVHLPAAGAPLAKTYRAIVKNLATVRQSLFDPIAEIATPGPVSLVASSLLTGPKLRPRRQAAAVKLAKQRTAATGRKCIVCPAVEPRSDKCKCGSGCHACTMSHVDVVFPHH